MFREPGRGKRNREDTPPRQLGPLLRLNEGSVRGAKGLGVMAAVPWFEVVSGCRYGVDAALAKTPANFMPPLRTWRAARVSRNTTALRALGHQIAASHFCKPSAVRPNVSVRLAPARDG